MTPDRVGRFRIEGPLGQGGMGEVYLAVDEELHRKVAIKALPSTLAGDERLRDRLRVEARTLAAVSHPSVGQIHDVISEGSNHYLVLEYVEGTSLASCLKEGRPSLEQALDLAVDIAEGLEAAHARGIVHRDLKAENVMVTPAGHAKILDFGLAKVLLESARRTDDSGAHGKGIAGTLSAMSPEQVERRTVDHRSDLFSFGTLLYQMVAGSHPFRQGLPVETMQRIVSHEPTAPRRLNRLVPRRLSQLIMELLEKAVESRPAEATQVAARLRLIRSDVEAEASESVRDLRARRRRRISLTVAAVVVAISATAIWWFSRPPAPAPPLSVAVLLPTTTDEDPNERFRTVASAVRLGIINTLTGLEGVVVINTGDIDAIAGSAREVARAVAADEVITTSATASDDTYILAISRLHGADGHVQWADQLQVPADELHLVAAAAAGYIDAAYPERRRRPGALEMLAGPEQYEAFLETRNRVLNPAPDVSWPDLLEEMAEIRKSSPKLLNAYVIEASIARYLYFNTNDPLYMDHGEEVIKAVLEVAPDDFRSLLAEADSAVAWGQLERAETALDRAERIEPASLAAMRLRARLEERRGNPQRALELFTEVAERWPSWRNLLNLAKVARNQGKIDTARENMEKALDRAPHNIIVKANLAFLELMNGDLNRAEQLFLEVVARSARPGYLSDLGTAEMLLGRYEEALGCFNRAFSMGSASPVTMLNLADCHNLLGNIDESHALYQDIVESLSEASNPTSKNLRLLAQALAQLERFDEAIATAERAMALAPESGDTMFTLALVHSLAGDTTRAREYYRQAIDAGVGKRWFDLPWFDAVRDADPGLQPSATGKPGGPAPD